MTKAETLADTLHALNAICPDAVIGVDERGRVDLWNRAASALFGWSEEEISGHPLPPVLEALNPAIESGDSVVATVEAKDGRRIALEFRAAKRIFGGFVILAGDLSRATALERERVEFLKRERESNLRLKSESRFRELLEAAPDAIIEVDRDGRIVLLNRVAETLFGYSRDELLGRNVDGLLPLELAARHAEHRARYWANPGTRPMGAGYILSARRCDGSEFPVEISLSPVRTEDGFRVTAIIRDVTRQRQAEEEIRLANQQLALRSQEAERANALKSEFLASMSHELRTPLHTVIGFTELLKEESEGPLNEKQKRFIQHVHQDSQHLLELINDILDLSKIEAGRMDLNIENIDAGAIVAGTVAAMKPAAAVKDIAVENAVAAPLTVRADRVRLREIMTNLLSNALKFTPDGGCVRIEALRVDENTIAISVEDTGIGIAPEYQEAVFDKFRQIAPTTRGVREGTGLGLAIVKRLVEMHGGTISLESAPGRGSRFTFSLSSEPAKNRSEALALVIEDEAAARELLSGYFDRMGVRSECAASAEEGLLKARDLRPDVILLDLLLPGRTGWHLLEDLRAGAETRSLPVFVTSVLDFDQAAMALGAIGYLQKPLKKDALVRALKEHLPERFGSL